MGCHFVTALSPSPFGFGEWLGGKTNISHLIGWLRLLFVVGLDSSLAWATQGKLKGNFDGLAWATRSSATGCEIRLRKLGAGQAAEQPRRESPSSELLPTSPACRPFRHRSPAASPSCNILPCHPRGASWTAQRPRPTKRPSRSRF
ncbi:hypothetical protein EJ110_NYTH43652 [Nymphaea thermarum]|nr:hypothetical protein EJ110_NYTH43652 [Nymphaea thermarum]